MNGFVQIREKKNKPKNQPNKKGKIQQCPSLSPNINQLQQLYLLLIFYPTMRHLGTKLSSLSILYPAPALAETEDDEDRLKKIIFLFSSGKPNSILRQCQAHQNRQQCGFRYYRKNQ